MNLRIRNEPVRDLFLRPFFGTCGLRGLTEIRGTLDRNRQRANAVRTFRTKVKYIAHAIQDHACRVNSFGLIARVLQLHGAVTFCALNRALLRLDNT